MIISVLSKGLLFSACAYYEVVTHMMNALTYIYLKHPLFSETAVSLKY